MALTTTDYTEYELTQGGGIENIEINNKQLELRQAKDKIKKRNILPELYDKLSSYPIHKQETRYYCGPAAV